VVSPALLGSNSFTANDGTTALLPFARPLIELTKDAPLKVM